MHVLTLATDMLQFISCRTLISAGYNPLKSSKCLQLDQRTDALVILKMVAEALVNLKSIREQVLIPAKVPILRLKFMEPFAELAVDLNVNNSVAIRNTHLLYYYSLCEFLFLSAV